MRPMLADRAPADMLALTFPLAAEIKHNGLRCIVAVERAGKARLHSRNGKPLTNFKEIQTQASAWPVGIYDGEITSTSFEQLMRRASAKDGTNTDVPITYEMFDNLTFNEWQQGSSPRPYSERCMEAGIGERLVVKNAQELDTYYQKVLADGHEGLMLKTLSGGYVSGKSKLWLKLKPKDTMDMTIKGVTISDVNPEHIAALYVEAAGEKEYEGYTLACNVHSGMTNAQLAEFYVKQKELIGKTVEIEYYEITKPTYHNRSISLRFPSFKCLRIDK